MTDVADLRLEWNAERKCFTIREWGGFFVEVIPMFVNDRLVMTPAAEPYGYDHGWCYEKGAAAVLAAVAWDPETEDEPPGFVKRATPGRREAPGRDPHAGWRCRHGKWRECHVVGCERWTAP